MSKYLEYTKEGQLKLPNIKCMFIPDVGKELADADYSGADIQIVGADSNCKWLLDYFENPRGNGKVYHYIASEYFQKDISDKDYKKYKGVFHGCLTGEHEVLTREGWIRIDEYDESKELAVWDSEDKSIFFEVPTAFNRDFVRKEEDLYTIEGSSFSFLGTQDHKFPKYSRNLKTYSKVEAVNINKSALLPYTGNYVGGDTELDYDYIRLIAALQADGNVKHIDKYGVGTFSFKFAKERKIARLKEILHNLNIPYSETPHKEVVGEAPQVDIWFKGFLQVEHKQLDWYILEYTRDCLDIFVNELVFWDGNKGVNGEQTIYSSNKKAVEVMQTIIQLSGKGSKVCRLASSDIVGHKEHFRVTINPLQHYTVRHGTRGLVKHEGTKVYCPTTSTGYFMYRYKGNIAVSSNSNYLMGVAKLADMAGISYMQAKELQDFYFGLCPEIPKWQDDVRKTIAKQGYLTTIFGRRRWFLDRNDPMLANKAAAFKPSATIADLVNRGWVNIVEKHPHIDILLQTHDSLTCQYDISTCEESRKDIIDCMEIPLRFPATTITIPADLQVSRKSYGDVAKPETQSREFGIKDKREIGKL